MQLFLGQSIRAIPMCIFKRLVSRYRHGLHLEEYHGPRDLPDGRDDFSP